MNTLPANRSVNTFQNNPVRRSSLSGLRYPRSSSLYLPQNEGDNESQNQLIPNDSHPRERRAQTLGRPAHQPTGRSHNLTNPLFDSVGSLEQPWYRSYGESVTLSPPTISLPVRPMEQTNFATAREMQPTIRVPSTRSPTRMSAYSAGYRTIEQASRQGYDPVQKRGCTPCMGLNCCEPESNPYSIPEESNDDWKQNEQNKPWIVCLFTVSTIFDLLLMGILAVVVFFLNCSVDGWFYSDRRVLSICTTLWSDWIPLHHRTFRCPALPPGYEGRHFDSNNPWQRPVMGNFQPPLTTPIYGSHMSQHEREQRVFSRENLRGLVYPDHNAWDADLGLMPPPRLTPYRAREDYEVTTTRLYGPTYNRNEEPWGRPREKWLKLNPSAPYSALSTGSIIVGCLVLPIFLVCDLCRIN